MFGAIFLLFIVPWVSFFKVKSSRFNIFFQFYYWLFIFNFLLLGWLGAQSAEEPFVTISQIAAVFYFAYFLIILPALSFIDLKCSKIKS